MIIAIEGIDGSGKSTQVKLLAEKLKTDRVIHFPAYQTVIGKIIGAYLKKEWKVLGAEGTNLEAMVFQGLQFANRLEMAGIIHRASSNGEVVICDRYISSGIVYGAATGLDEKYLEEAQRYLPQPDVSILLNIKLEDSFRRRATDRDLYEENRSFLEEVADRYRLLWVGRPDNWLAVDASGDVQAVHEQIMAHVLKFCSLPV